MPGVQPMSFGEEIASWHKREAVEAVVKSMELGQRVRFDFRAIREAYPPVGDGGSALSAFKAMALARGGNRPEPNLSSEDRFRTFLARNGFVIEFSDPIQEYYAVERRREKCEECRGLGQRQVLDPLDEPTAFSGENSAEATVSFSLQPCQPCAGRGYLPAKGDPDARFGDHSASDAWIERKRRERISP